MVDNSLKMRCSFKRLKEKSRLMTRVRRHELETGKIEVVGLVFGERRLENGSEKRRQVQEGEEKL